MFLVLAYDSNSNIERLQSGAMHSLSCPCYEMLESVKIGYRPKLKEAHDSGPSWVLVHCVVVSVHFVNNSVEGISISRPTGSAISPSACLAWDDGAQLSSVRRIFV
jgi:hypothetical protein